MMTSKKKGLKIKEVSKNSEYSGITQNQYPYSRFVVRFNEGKNLLASDITTGKSDPVCFVWCGPKDITPDPDDEDSSILRTKVCKTTIDPIWNEEMVFPLDVSDLISISEMKCLIYVRDEDNVEDNPDMKTYDELGMLNISLKDLILKGKLLKESIVKSADWYTLQLTPKTKQNPIGMRNIDGSIKLSISLIFAPEDFEVISKQVSVNGMLDIGKTITGKPMISIAQQVQNYIKKDPNESNSIAVTTNNNNGVDPKLKLSLTGIPRPASASSSRSTSRSNLALTNIAPMVKRPNTASPLRKKDQLLLDNGRISNSNNNNEEVIQEEQEQDIQNENQSISEEIEELNIVKEKSHSSDYRKDIRVKMDNIDMTDLLNLDPDGGDQTAFIEDLVKIGLQVSMEAANDLGQDFYQDNLHDAVAYSAVETAHMAKKAASKLAKYTANGVAANSNILENITTSSKETASSLGSSAKDVGSSISKGFSITAKGASKILSDNSKAVTNYDSHENHLFSETILFDPFAEVYSGDQNINPGDEPDVIKSDKTQPIVKPTESTDKTQSTVKPTESTDKTQSIVKPIESTDKTQSTVKPIESTDKTQSIVKPTENTDKTQPIVKPTESTDKTQSIVKPTESTDKTQSIVKPIESTDKTQPIVKPIESTDKTQSIVKPTENTDKTQPIVKPTESTDKTQSIVKPTESTDKTQPIVKPTESTDKTQSIVKPIESTDKTQPIVKPTESTDKTQSTVKPTESTDKTQSIVKPIESTDKTQPIVKPIESTDKTQSIVKPTETNIKTQPIVKLIDTNDKTVSDIYAGDQNINPGMSELDVSRTKTNPPNQSNLKQQLSSSQASNGSSSSSSVSDRNTNLDEIIHAANNNTGGGGGHTMAVIRALREMTLQHRSFEQNIEKIAEVTAKGFSKLSDRIITIENNLKKSQNFKNNILELEDIDESNAYNNDEEYQEKVGSKRNLSRTSPAKVQDIKLQRVNSSSNNNTTKENKFGSLYAISKAKQIASTIRKDQVTKSSSLQPSKPIYQPYATFTEENNNCSNNSNGNSNNNGKNNIKKSLRSPVRSSFEPAMQLVYKDTEGRVASTHVDTKEQEIDQYQRNYNPNQQNQYVNENYSSYHGRDSSAMNNDYQIGRVNNNNSGQDYNYQGNNKNNNNTAHSSNNNHNYSSNSLPTAQIQQQNKYPLNRDFHEVLDRGSLEDVARLLESTAPKPEDVSASVRNRLYDAIATILHHNNPLYMERCLIWTLALVRGNQQLIDELAGYTKRDLKEALDKVALEPSKRGLLASLLKSQINQKL